MRDEREDERVREKERGTGSGREERERGRRGGTRRGGREKEKEKGEGERVACALSHVYAREYTHARTHHSQEEAQAKNLLTLGDTVEPFSSYPLSRFYFLKGTSNNFGRFQLQDRLQTIAGLQPIGEIRQL